MSAISVILIIIDAKGRRRRWGVAMVSSMALGAVLLCGVAMEKSRRQTVLSVYNKIGMEGSYDRLQ
jgi:hypothetical protein